MAREIEQTAHGGQGARALLALAVGAIVGTSPYVAFTTIIAENAGAYRVETTLVVWAASSVVGFIGNCTLGVAWHQHALNNGAPGLASYATAGAILGVLTGALLGVFFSAFNPADFLSNIAAWSLLLAVYGVLSASIFWLIRRPDRDQASGGGTKDTSA